MRNIDILASTERKSRGVGSNAGVQDRVECKRRGGLHEGYRTHMAIGRQRSDPLVGRVRKLS